MTIQGVTDLMESNPCDGNNANPLDSSIEGEARDDPVNEDFEMFDHIEDDLESEPEDLKPVSHKLMQRVSSTNIVV
jgi:hypothetical protein